MVGHLRRGLLGKGEIKTMRRPSRNLRENGDVWADCRRGLRTADRTKTQQCFSTAVVTEIPGSRDFQVIGPGWGVGGGRNSKNITNGNHRCQFCDLLLLADPGRL